MKRSAHREYFVFNISPLVLAGIIILVLLVKFYCPLFYDLPLSSGYYGVGVTSYHWIDEQRTDFNMPSGKREIMVDVFYPAVKSSEKNGIYQKRKMSLFKNHLSKEYWLARYFGNFLLHTGNDYTQLGASVALQEEESYPVVIFLPGIGGGTSYTTYITELVSYGYVVTAITPPGDVAVMEFSDGNIVEVNEVLAHASKHMLRDKIYAYRTQAHTVWKADIHFVIKQLNALNDDPGSTFFHKLDLNNLGLMGHSHGGAVVTDFCSTNKVCKAGINMDGWTKTVPIQPFSTPFLFLMQEEGLDDVTAFYAQLNPATAQKIHIPHALHGAFSDDILLKQPLARWLGVVQKNADQVRRQIIQHIREFFDRYLKSRD